MFGCSFSLPWQSDGLTMATNLVTGGSGHLGANLVRGLLQEGASVRVIARWGSKNQALDGLDVERVEGDVRDYQSVLAVVRGCAKVFHAAAKISIMPGTPQLDRELFETNVIGTRNVLRAAREAGARRVVVTGSVTAVGRRLDDPSRPSDEDIPFFPFDQVSGAPAGDGEGAHRSPLHTQYRVSIDRFFTGAIREGHRSTAPDRASPGAAGGHHGARLEPHAGSAGTERAAASNSGRGAFPALAAPR